MDIQVIGSNHRTSPIEFRERIALNDDEIRTLIGNLKDTTDAREATILSTCNRFEVYSVSDDPHATKEALLKHLLKLKGVKDRPPKDYFYTMLNKEAVKHLFKVSAGVDSMVRGEPQILGQVKDAYRLGTSANGNGTLFYRLFHMAFRVGKRVRTETEIGIGAVSISNAAVELARKVYGDLSGKRALIIGAGEMAELAMEHLKKKGVHRITVANRTFSRGQMMARRLGLAAIPLSGIYSELIDTDLVVVSTSGLNYLIGYDQMKEVMSGRKMRHLLILDISHPRNVEPRVGEIENIFLYDIDSLKGVVDKNIVKREEALPRIESIIECEAEKFMQWVNSLKLNPVIEEIGRSLDAVRYEEVKRIANRNGYPDEQELHRITQGLMNKVLHRLVTNIKLLDADQEKRLLAYDLVARLFKSEES